MHRRSSTLFCAPLHVDERAFWLVALAFPVAFVAVALSEAPARAHDRSVRTSVSIQSAIVLDFDVAPGLDSALGRKAADAVRGRNEKFGRFRRRRRASALKSWSQRSLVCTRLTRRPLRVDWEKLPVPTSSLQVASFPQL